MHYVYILYNKNIKKRYIGSTDDLKRRVSEHQSGKVKSTKHDTHWILIYYEGFISKRDARREELFLKSGRGRERLKYLFSE